MGGGGLHGTFYKRSVLTFRSLPVGSISLSISLAALLHHSQVTRLLIYNLHTEIFRGPLRVTRKSSLRHIVAVKIRNIFGFDAAGETFASDIREYHNILSEQGHCMELVCDKYNTHP